MLIRDIVQDKKLACVMVTHEEGQAARLAQRALLLNQGKIVRTGPVSEVLHA
jgi:ABC-type cobalamin/Fe3+-siderophores transport system ATPase subunit